ncbi:LysR family transcriptional regulator [Hydrogenophaga crassostreae]|uniref:LysR family transcriptional regulator n=1 Tax=Hydrogenophaga crassostreae TaxID=1763535 RepID=A0A167I806_9BURK|nr:LysR family transcriptional regulator [Hydrogenophaga crassostreae]AOW11828.1 LysR family transcriptional regulator [Hydrogenophaga crassostreae]OAD42324.1 LysR family transcriptional regulator [Hydrogenophaga crassostreae]
MRDLDLTTLRLFVAVCETRNIARAAAQANLVGSAVSKRLAQLEAQLGTPLLLRRRHGVEPTAAGESLLEHARAMLVSAQRMERDMAAFAAGVRGQVRVLASASAMAEALVDDVASFLQAPEHRNLRVDLEEHISTAVIQGVRNGIASLGVCWDASDLHGLQSLPYRRDRLALVVPADHPLAQVDRLAFAEATDWDFVGIHLNSSVHLMLMRAAAEQGKTMSIRIIVSSIEAALRVVRAKLGICVVPGEVARPYADSYGLRVIPLTDTWAERRFAVCFRDEQALAPAAKLLLAHLGQ